MDPRLLSYISVTFLFAVTPGATTAVVVRNALTGGRPAGVRTALGAAAGSICQATAAGVGLAVLLRHWPVAFAAVRIAGAIYLASLGVRSLWQARQVQPHLTNINSININEGPGAGPRLTGSDFRQGLLTNLLNPSVGTFYLAIVPSFVDAVGLPAPFAVLAAIHVSIAFACHACWATAFAKLRLLFRRPAFARTLDACTGLALLALAWTAAKSAL